VPLAAAGAALELRAHRHAHHHRLRRVVDPLAAHLMEADVRRADLDDLTRRVARRDHRQGRLEARGLYQHHRIEAVQCGRMHADDRILRPADRIGESS
jgi:hypothetical protein